jgi:hypothetical protein
MAVKRRMVSLPCWRRLGRALEDVIGQLRIADMG